MVHTEIFGGQRFIMDRADPREDLLQVLQFTVARENIRIGAIPSGVGSIAAYHIHVAATASLPTPAAHFRGEGAFDIASLNGTILDGKFRPHMAFANKLKAMGGHGTRATRC